MATGRLAATSALLTILSSAPLESASDRKTGASISAVELAFVARLLLPAVSVNVAKTDTAPVADARMLAVVEPLAFRVPDAPAVTVQFALQVKE